MSFLDGLGKTLNFITSPFAALGGLVESAFPGSQYHSDHEAGNLDYWDYVNIHRGDYTNSASGVDSGAVSGVPQNSDVPEASLDTSGYDQAEWAFEKQKELLESQQAFNSAEAQKNRDWQERLSNTAYQRATEDLQAAGLNKWLAVTGGNGASASTPSGSSASSSAGSVSTPSPELAKAILQFGQSVLGNVIKVIGS